MHDVPLSDDVYQRAAKAAKDKRLSLEEFVAEAVQTYLRDGEESPLVLSPEQAETVRKRQAEVKSGEFLTLEQMQKRSSAKRAAWLSQNAH